MPSTLFNDMPWNSRLRRSESGFPGDLDPSLRGGRTAGMDCWELRSQPHLQAALCARRNVA